MKQYTVESWDTLQHLFKIKKINNHILHFSADFSSCLDADILENAIGLLADAFPLIRSAYVETRGKRPVWQEGTHTAKDMLTVIVTDHPLQEASAFLCRETDLINGPQFHAALIRSGNKDTLCVLINHMLCDAAGFKELLYLLAELYCCLADHQKPVLHDRTKNRTVHQLLKQSSMKEKMKLYFSGNQLNPHGTQQFTLQGDLSRPFIEMRRIPPDDVISWKNYAKKKQVSMNDIMLTAFQRTLFHIFSNSSDLPCAIDLRRFLKDRETDGICNLVSNICCQTAVDPADSFETTLQKIKAEMDRKKKDPQSFRNVLLLETLYHILPYPIIRKVLSQFFQNPYIAFTNIGILDDKKLSFGSTAVMQRAFMTGSVKYAPYFQLSLSTFRQEAVLCVNLYGTESDQKKTADFLELFVSELKQVTAASVS